MERLSTRHGVVPEYWRPMRLMEANMTHPPLLTRAPQVVTGVVDGGRRRCVSAAPRRSTEDVYSRKVFLGGLPVDCTETDLLAVLRPYGAVTVDWPHKTPTEHAHYGRPKGYAFAVYADAWSVARLSAVCTREGDKLMLRLLTARHDKRVHVSAYAWS